MDGSDSLRWEPGTRSLAGHKEERRSARSGRLGTGTLACNRCDAPVVLTRAAGPTEVLSCPFCSHRAPLREFLSLAKPARPARVEVRVVAPPGRFPGISSTG
jgi:hypothetical protein